MDKFSNIFILGRPASGKSELIDFLKKMPYEERLRRVHIGKFEEIDDFPWIWEICSHDDELEAKGQKRIHSEKTLECYNILTPGFRGSLVDRFNKAIAQKYLNHPEFYEDGTLLIEFARGKGDGFQESLDRFKPEILRKAVIFYIDISFEESVRRNNARYEAAKKSSILCHKVPDKDMHDFFIENDWAKITNEKRHGFIKAGGVDVPFVAMHNEPELPPGPEIARRYESAFSVLFELYVKSR